MICAFVPNQSARKRKPAARFASTIKILKEVEAMQCYEEYWRAVQQKDRAYDGVFVVAVRSTGVYCRPTCSARMPRRENVSFFSSPQEAVDAGFRACKRCLPDGEQDAHVALVQAICRYIAKADCPPRLADLSERFHLSPFHLQRVFKRATGVSPRQYYDAHRVEQFKASLKEGEPVTRALYDAGFSSVSQLYPGMLGMTPTTYQKGGEGQIIRYSIAPSELGLLLVAATERGLCAVRLSDSADDLMQQLEDEFPAAEIERDDEGVGAWIDEILRYIDQQPCAIEALPLDIKATAFQRRVWEALRQIPYGQTRSYRDIANAIGQPKAVRAVAQACGANPVPLVIPCHRVINSNGDLGGYSMGIERKKKLLANEKAISQPTLFETTESE
jgi:AraC family transcriptional regulator, regulatory protein of adaptative response / methylated-DNA-[protein]-cysteine methyltransferase